MVSWKRSSRWSSAARASTWSPLAMALHMRATVAIMLDVSRQRAVTHL
jgi:hypothetical protein